MSCAVGLPDPFLDFLRAFSFFSLFIRLPLPRLCFPCTFIRTTFTARHACSPQRRLHHHTCSHVHVAYASYSVQNLSILSSTFEITVEVRSV